MLKSHAGSLLWHSNMPKKHLSVELSFLTLSLSNNHFIDNFIYLLIKLDITVCKVAGFLTV